MPDFTYEALTKQGNRDQGTVSAGSEREAASMLDARGLFPISVRPAKSAAKSSFGFGRKVRGRAMATFYSQLADLIHAGVPLLKALDLLSSQSPSPLLREVLREVRARVADGTSLADAMRPFPYVFNELAVSMVRAGQEGGFLEDVLKRIAAFMDHQEEMKGKVVGAMAYPVFLGVIGVLVLNALVIFFVPQFKPIFEGLEKKDQLPMITKIVVGISNTMQTIYWWIGVLVLVGLFFQFLRWSRTPNGRLITDRIRLKLPGFGKLFLALSLARFTRILGTMLQNGIPILRALNIAKDSTGNRVLSLAIEQSAENITGGQKLAEPFRRNKFLPRDIVEMIAIGEESNTLETVLLHIAESLEKRTARQLELFVRLLEPVMLLGMALVTLFIILGLLMPVFKLGSAIN